MDWTNTTVKGPSANYADELKKTLRYVHRCVANNISLAQKRQKKDYDNMTKLQSTQIKAGDQVCLNSKAVSRKKSRKIHQEWTGPYVVLCRLVKVNYHIKSAEGKGQTIVVHRNRLKTSKNDLKEGQAKTLVLRVRVSLPLSELARTQK